MKPEHRIFADEYLKDHNASRAYRVAYPKCKSEHAAESAASRLLKNVEVSAYIEEREKAESDEINSRRILDKAQLMEFYSSVIRGEVVDESVTPAGVVVETRPRIIDKLSAADKLAKMLGVDKGLDREKFEYEKSRNEIGTGDDIPLVIDDIPGGDSA